MHFLALDDSSYIHAVELVVTAERLMPECVPFSSTNFRNGIKGEIANEHRYQNTSHYHDRGCINYVYLAQSAKDARGATPFIPVGQEQPVKLIVDAPIPLALAHGVVLIQYHAENVHIVPVFGPAALNIFPRVGHLHINVDDLPWHWADASDTGTIDIKDLPPGQHKVMIDLVDGNHQLFPGQSVTVTFTVPDTGSHAH